MCESVDISNLLSYSGNNLNLKLSCIIIKLQNIWRIFCSSSMFCILWSSYSTTSNDTFYDCSEDKFSFKYFTLKCRPHKATHLQRSENHKPQHLWHNFELINKPDCFSECRTIINPANSYKLCFYWRRNLFFW